MTIIKRRHNGCFTVAPNAIFNDRRLSVEAIGVLVYLLSLPNDWRVRLVHLQKKLDIGRQRLQRVMRELIAAGYVERDNEQPRDDRNKFTSFNYIVRDVPTNVTSLPQVDFVQRGSRGLKISTDTKKEIINTNNKKPPLKVSPAVPAAAPQEAANGKLAEYGTAQTDVPAPTATPQASELALTAFGRAAQDQGCRFVWEGSKAAIAWSMFRGRDGMPPIDEALVQGERRRGFWFLSLFPPMRRGLVVAE